MYTDVRKSHFVGSMIRTTLLSALLLAPIASSAQTFYGQGGSPNLSPDVPNLAFGFDALLLNTGINNTALGYQTLMQNLGGYDNTAAGYQSLVNNTTGYANTAHGMYSLLNNTTGVYNASHGFASLVANSVGSRNTAVGMGALENNTTGNQNIALGFSAGQNLTTGSFNIDIGNGGVAGESNVIRIGVQGDGIAAPQLCYVAGISGINVSGAAVYVTSSGQLGTITSSRRFKKDIHDMGSISDKLMQLRPVTFRYKAPAENGTHPVQYGLIAEEVAKVYPDLVQYDKQGKPFTIYYHLLTPMLLNELQKTHRENVAMKAAHQAEVASLKAALKAQGAELTALKQTQQQQMAALAKLTTLVQASQSRGSVASVTVPQH